MDGAHDEAAGAPVDFAVVPSLHADGTVYVTQRGREDDDFAAYVYKSTDFGRTFRASRTTSRRAR